MLPRRRPRMPSRLTPSLCTTSQRPWPVSVSLSVSVPMCAERCACMCTAALIMCPHMEHDKRSGQEPFPGVIQPVAGRMPGG